ncbi:NADH dehydrogenase I subunit 4L [Vigna unguiculata]|uniref:ATP synthase protein MI25 n=1 Tax=Vigna unguiculata TaxID=3917 RepID=A0A4D6KND0_VIGUN|nr:NADH dehydrogenase I subunit 4L [Vigna unguiculata]
MSSLYGLARLSEFLTIAPCDAGDSLSSPLDQFEIIPLIKENLSLFAFVFLVILTLLFYIYKRGFIKQHFKYVELEELWNFTKRKKKEVLKGNLILRRKDIKRIRESLMGLLKWRKGKNDKGDGARLPTRRIGIRGILLNRRNIPIMSMPIESMLLAVNSNFLVFSISSDDMMGQSFASLVSTVAAAESAIGLAIFVITFRVRGTIAVEFINNIQGFIIFSWKSLGNTFKVTLDGRIQVIQEESQQFPNPNEVVPPESNEQQRLLRISLRICGTVVESLPMARCVPKCEKTVQALLCRNLNVKSATLPNATSSRRIRLQDDLGTKFHLLVIFSLKAAQAIYLKKEEQDKKDKARKLRIKSSCSNQAVKSGYVGSQLGKRDLSGGLKGEKTRGGIFYPTICVMKSFGLYINSHCDYDVGHFGESIDSGSPGRLSQSTEVGADKVYPGQRFTRYAILGDDVCIADENVTSLYRQTVNDLGVLTWISGDGRRRPEAMSSRGRSLALGDRLAVSLATTKRLPSAKDSFLSQQEDVRLHLKELTRLTLPRLSQGLVSGSSSNLSHLSRMQGNPHVRFLGGRASRNHPIPIANIWSSI